MDPFTGIVAHVLNGTSDPNYSMICHDNTSIQISQLAEGVWLNRPEYHIPCIIISLLIILLYILELRVVFRYRRFAPFTSTYFRIWTLQAVADLLSLSCYICFSFTRNMPWTWNFWMRINDTPLPGVIIVLNGAVILSQMTGVALTSVNRYLKLCKPTDITTARFDNTKNWQLLFLILVFPLLVSGVILFNSSPIFVYTDGYSSVIAPCFRKAGDKVYAVVAPLCCVVTLFTSTICYIKIISKISTMNYMKTRAMKTERTLAILSIPVFLSLWLVFLYYTCIFVAMIFSWKNGYDLLFAFYYLLNLGLSISNPISALFSRDIRSRLFFERVEISSSNRLTLLS